MVSFSFDYPVRIDDLDYMGIVGNAEWITLLTRARMDLLEEIQFSIAEMQKRKIGGVVAELNVKYLKPAFYNDRLTITIIPDSPFKKGLMLKYVVMNQNDKECLTAEVKIIFVDINGRPTEMPEIIAEKLFGASVSF